MIKIKKLMDDDPHSDFFDRYSNFNPNDKMSEFEDK